MCLYQQMIRWPTWPLPHPDVEYAKLSAQCCYKGTHNELEHPINCAHPPAIRACSNWYLVHNDAWTTSVPIHLILTCPPTLLFISPLPDAIRPGVHSPESPHTIKQIAVFSVITTATLFLSALFFNSNNFIKNLTCKETTLNVQKKIIHFQTCSYCS